MSRVQVVVARAVKGHCPSGSVRLSAEVVAVDESSELGPGSVSLWWPARPGFLQSPVGRVKLLVAAKFYDRSVGHGRKETKVVQVQTVEDLGFPHTAQVAKITRHRPNPHRSRAGEHAALRNLVVNALREQACC